jgi:hypothetical protein
VLKYELFKLWIFKPFKGVSLRVGPLGHPRKKLKSRNTRGIQGRIVRVVPQGDPRKKLKTRTTRRIKRLSIRVGEAIR